MRSHARERLIAASALTCALLAACGPAQPGTKRTLSPAGPSEGGDSAPRGGTSGPASPSSPSSPRGITPASPRGDETGASPVTMKPIASSAMAEDLERVGVDLHAPVPLNKLSPDTIRKVMPSFARSLGVKCDHCHDPDDFKAWTPNKRVAEKMWQELVVGLAMADGSPLYCDSCHAGRATFLDRHDPKALAAWMDASFVKGLKRTDERAHACEQCHGEPFVPKILRDWAKPTAREGKNRPR